MADICRLNAVKPQPTFRKLFITSHNFICINFLTYDMGIQASLMQLKFYLLVLLFVV